MFVLFFSGSMCDAEGLVSVQHFLLLRTKGVAKSGHITPTKYYRAA